MPEIVNTVSENRNFITEIKVNDIYAQVNIDSGASVNIIDGSSFSRLNRRGNIKFMKSKIKLFAYGSKIPLEVVLKPQLSRQRRFPLQNFM